MANDASLPTRRNAPLPGGFDGVQRMSEADIASNARLATSLTGVADIGGIAPLVRRALKDEFLVKVRFVENGK